MVPTFGLRKKLSSINLKKPKVGSQKLGPSFQKSDAEKRSSNLQPDFEKLRKRLKGCLCFYQSTLQTSTSSSQIWSAAEYPVNAASWVVTIGGQSLQLATKVLPHPPNAWVPPWTFVSVHAPPCGPPDRQKPYVGQVKAKLLSGCCRGC